jgi:hypothetical protein
MDDLRGAILRRLADREGDTRFGEPYFPSETARALDVRLIDVYETIQGRQGDGLVFLDPAGQAGAGSFDNWHWRLSEDGRAAAQSDSWEPRDPQRYLARLRERAPSQPGSRHVRDRGAAIVQCPLLSRLVGDARCRRGAGPTTGAHTGSSRITAGPILARLEARGGFAHLPFVEADRESSTRRR